MSRSAAWLALAAASTLTVSLQYVFSSQQVDVLQQQNCRRELLGSH